MAGARPVTTLAGLSEAEALLVCGMRRMAEGPAGVRAWQAELAGAAGPEAAAAACEALRRMRDILAAHGRRTVMHHARGCACVGADEAVLAHVVMTSATGDRDEAMLLASLLVDGPVLVPLVEAAAQAGLQALRFNCARRREATSGTPAAARLH